MNAEGGWEAPLAQLAQRRKAALAMGGAERVQRLITQRGKLHARARMALLFDDGAFFEVGALAGGPQSPADALVAGFGRINGRTALAAAEDFSVKGGSIGAASAAKRVRICELAGQARAPLVFMLDGAGHRLTEIEGAAGRAPNDLQLLADLNGRVPLLCLVLGASAGHGALTAPLSNFVVMTEAAAMFTGGPPLVKAALGYECTKQELGGPKVCAEIAGTAHAVAPDDAAAIKLARRYLGYLPQHAGARAPRGNGADAAPRLLKELPRVIPPNNRKPYSMHNVLRLLCDRGEWLEVQPKFGAAIICAHAHVGGHSVALVANNPAVRGGAVDSAAAQKAADFLETAGAFNLPVLFLADNPGVMAGVQAEREGVLKWAGKMFRAQRRLRGVKIHVTLRKAFGFGSSVMAHNPFDGQALHLSFPQLVMSAMPAQAGGASAKLGAEEQARAEAAQQESGWRMATGMATDDVIHPRELRNAILHGLELAQGGA